MSYTQENFQEWIFLIGEKMDAFTEDFAKENNLNLDYSIRSLDEIEKWIIGTYPTIKELRDDHKMLDLLTIYIGETFRKHIGGKWVMDTEDQENAYYMMPTLTSPDYTGEVYKSPRTFATASIPRKKGNYISTILKSCMQDMSIPIEE
ncbi:hypothetical protein MUU74_00540 [Chryseobacterium daecheongense]|uniref:hypothetical protein n=1 Tax=Chryseobacterium daecheongense TaxID=192389 RepID=UPI001FD718A8|nr:hypothetical protein [Chryseobacterium daecheongense]UOU98469.1 hypothetical protein MUU74_00540 [Chryseobacterium daecheongense]